LDDEPRKRLDRPALVVHGLAIGAIVGIAAFLLYEMKSQPEPPRPAVEDRRLQDAVTDIRKWIEEKRGEVQPEPTPASRPPQAPAFRGPPVAPGAGALLSSEANHLWRYAVSVDPQTWRDIALTYRVPRENGRLVVDTHFTHAAGEMRFRLGRLEAGDPAHANTRFPGFFLHSAYIPYPLQAGQRLTWGWPWQGRSGGIKQFEGEVKGVERVTVPLDTFEAVRIDAVIKYIDNGKVAATSHETIWVAPRVHGIVKIVRDGVTPDEGFRRIVAELAEYK
jgi:hypothetical protein